MCNVPPKFYQVCRLCLNVVNDDCDFKKLNIFEKSCLNSNRNQQQQQNNHKNVATAFNVGGGNNSSSTTLLATARDLSTNTVAVTALLTPTLSSSSLSSSSLPSSSTTKRNKNEKILVTNFVDKNNAEDVDKEKGEEVKPGIGERKQHDYDNSNDTTAETPDNGVLQVEACDDDDSSFDNLITKRILSCLSIKVSRLFFLYFFSTLLYFIFYFCLSTLV